MGISVKKKIEDEMKTLTMGCHFNHPSSLLAWVGSQDCTVDLQYEFVTPVVQGPLSQVPRHPLSLLGLVAIFETSILPLHHPLPSFFASSSSILLVGPKKSFNL